MDYLLKAWHTQRPAWHENGTCSCDLDCKNPESSWRCASNGFSAFIEALLCTHQPHFGLEWPQAPSSPPMFRRLDCCLLPRSGGRYLPLGPNRTRRTPCSKCGWSCRFVTHSDVVNLCKDEYNNEPATWKRKTTIDAGNGREKIRFADYTGTRAELLQEIEDTSQEFLYHRWTIAWTRWQFKLDIATFDLRSSILVLTNFAAIYEMKGETVGTCEHGISSHQLVNAM